MREYNQIHECPACHSFFLLKKYQFVYGSERIMWRVRFVRERKDMPLLNRLRMVLFGNSGYYRPRVIGTIHDAKGEK